MNTAHVIFKLWRIDRGGGKSRVQDEEKEEDEEGELKFGGSAVYLHDVKTSRESNWLQIICIV